MVFGGGRCDFEKVPLFMESGGGRSSLTFFSLSLSCVVFWGGECERESGVEMSFGVCAALKMTGYCAARPPNKPQIRVCFSPFHTQQNTTHKKALAPHLRPGCQPFFRSNFSTNIALSLCYNSKFNQAREKCSNN